MIRWVMLLAYMCHVASTPVYDDNLNLRVFVRTLFRKLSKHTGKFGKIVAKLIACIHSMSKHIGGNSLLNPEVVSDCTYIS
jgi:hypothetical protein